MGDAEVGVSPDKMQRENAKKVKRHFVVDKAVKFAGKFMRCRSFVFLPFVLNLPLFFISCHALSANMVATKHRTEYNEEQRVRILQMHGKGQSTRAIAAMLNLSQSGVAISSVVRKRVTPVSDLPRCGCPRKISKVTTLKCCQSAVMWKHSPT